jgi:hypothetical protein
MPNPTGYPIAPIGISAGAWASPGTAWDVRDYSDVEVQFVGTPSVAYQPRRSLNGTDYVDVLAYDQQGNSYSTITAAGIYSLDGGGYLLFSAGAGSDITRRAAA